MWCLIAAVLRPSPPAPSHPSRMSRTPQPASKGLTPDAAGGLQPPDPHQDAGWFLYSSGKMDRQTDIPPHPTHVVVEDAVALDR